MTILLCVVYGKTTTEKEQDVMDLIDYYIKELERISCRIGAIIRNLFSQTLQTERRREESNKSANGHTHKKTERKL